MKSTRKVLNDALGKQASRRSVMQKSGKSSCLIVFAMQKAGNLRLTITVGCKSFVAVTKSQRLDTKARLQGCLGDIIGR